MIKRFSPASSPWLMSIEILEYGLFKLGSGDAGSNDDTIMSM